MTDMRDGGGRQTIPLDNGWRFRQERVATAWLKGGWTSDEPTVNLPHCWNDRDTFKMGVRYHQGPGAYGLRFVLPQDLPPGQDCLWQLRSEGFYGVGDLWMNGKRIASVDGQYLGLREDVSGHVHLDRENTIGIRLTNAYRRHVLPGKRDPDFLLYGGLSGRVCLVRLPRVHLEDRSLHVVCDHPLASCAVVRLTVEATNARAEAQSLCVRATLVAPDGTVAVSGQSELTAVAARQSIGISLDLPVEHPVIWDLEHPRLYRAECELLVDGHPVDAVAMPFGLREAVFDGSRGFFLNGNPVRLCGVNRHESMPGFGRALPDDVHRCDVEQIRSMGLNFVRLSHYPQHPAFLDACDRAGVLVYAEIASWKSVRPGLWARAAYRQLQEMIRRDRHHPSIILWGLGNESRSRWAFRKMVRLARALDPSRATVYAENHLHRGIRWRTLNLTDVLGVNYELGLLDEAHARSRLGAVVVSEISNCAYTPRGDEAAELKQIAAMERDLDLLEKKPYVAGYALWCYADYASQRKGRCRRQSGLVDAWRLPKMSASYMRARTARDLCLGVHGDWADRGESGPRRIHVFSNAEWLVASVKGKTLARVPARRYTTLTLPFSPDVLDITAERGNERRFDQLVPHGVAAQVVLALDRSSCKAVDRETVGMLVRVADTEGRTASDYQGEVRVTVEGPAQVRFFSSEDVVEIRAGRGRCFVTGTGAAGAVTLSAMVEGLRRGVARLEYMT